MLTSRELIGRGGFRAFLLVASPDEELVCQIARFSIENDILDAAFTATGGCRSATLKSFDPLAAAYRTVHVEGPSQITCNGSIVALGDDVSINATAAIWQGSDTVSGFLQHASVFPAMEIILTSTPAHQKRGTGLPSFIEHVHNPQETDQ